MNTKPKRLETANDLYSAMLAVANDAQSDDLERLAVKAGFLVRCPSCRMASPVGAPPAHNLDCGRRR